MLTTLFLDDKGFSSLLDDEVEDEDEDGVGKNGQRGLDEFGFIDTRLHKDQQAEEDATKIQIGDFDNIVDTLSDDEGDEDALEKFRLERDRLEDIAKQKGTSLTHSPTHPLTHSLTHS